MRKLKLFGIVLLSIFLIGIGGFFIYAQFYYRAEPIALELLSNSTNITTHENLTILTPDFPTDTAYIFYPGAKVEAISYLPLLSQLTDLGITCILVDMPLRFAFLNVNAAEPIFDLFPQITNWYIGGHSLGGSMASSYASSHPEKINGLILLGSYVYGSYPTTQSLTIYGTFNSNLEAYITYDDNIVIIEGGNHAQFGNYGPQKGDPEATITNEEQQKITVQAIAEFLNISLTD